jgi:hypothetical protein
VKTEDVDSIRQARVRSSDWGWRQLAWTAFFTGLLYLVPTSNLWQRVAPRRDITLPVWVFDDSVQQLPVVLANVPADDLAAGTFRHEIPLTIQWVPADYDAVALMMATYMSTSQLVSAELKVQGTTCLYHQSPNGTLVDNKPLQLVPTEGCQSLTSPAPLPDGKWQGVLTIIQSGAPNLALWSVKGSLVIPPPLAVAASAAPDGAYPIATLTPRVKGAALQVEGLGSHPGEYTDQDLRGSQLLAYLWGRVPTSDGFVYGIVAISYLIVTLGSFLVLRRLWGLSLGPGMTSFGVAIMFWGIGLLYTLVIPPYQAPDEPDHVLTYLTLSPNSALAKDALDLANQGHFERIKFKHQEKFAVSDIDRPMSGPWASHITATDTLRSPYITAIWQTVAKATAHFSISKTIWLLRAINLSIVTLAIMVGILILELCQKSSVGSSLILGLLVPTLPFFSMHVSNYSVLIAGWILQAIVVLGLLNPDVPSRRPLLGAGIAVSAALQLFGGNAGILALAFWGVFFGTLVITRGPRIRLTHGAQYLMGMALGTLVMILLVLPIVPNLVEFVQLKLSFINLQKVLELRMAGAAALLIAFVVVAWQLLVRFARGHRRLSVLCVRSFLILGLVGTILIPLDPLPNIETPTHLGRLGYVTLTLGNFLYGLGLGPIDGFIVTSFWGGFGWLDAILNPRIIWGVKGIVSFGIGYLIWRRVFSLGKDWAATFFACVVGSLVWLSALAVATNLMGINLHGRYMIGVYLLIIAIGSFGIQDFVRHQDYPRLTWSVILLALVGVHMDTLLHLQLRYLAY